MAPRVVAGRYHVQRAVGRGGMGTVWLCHDDVLNREVALKQVGTLPGEATPDVARALREARLSAALNHRNVVSIFDAVEDSEHIWLVMEYVPSRTLSQIISEEGPLSPERAVGIGAQVADGLAAAHALRTIHRDVKPGNILVTENDLAKVSDFGIARTLGDAQLTQAGLVTGTPSYFSPELARGEEPGPAADVWALGATLYAAVEGRPPYPEQRNALAMLSTIAVGHPPRPDRAGFLTEPITRMLDPDPGSRWSMADVAHVLHRLRDQHVPTTREATTAFTSSFAGGALTGASAYPPEPDAVSLDDEPEAIRARPDQGGNGGRLLVIGLLAMLAVIGVVGILLLNDTDAPSTTATDPGTRLSAGASQDTGGRSASTDDTPTGAPTGSPSSTSPSPIAAPSRTASSASVSPTGEPTGSPSSAPSSTTAAPSRTASSPPAQSSELGQQFVTDYYAALPDDPETGWSQLSPARQAESGSYGRYSGFWAGIEAVQVTDTAPAPGGAVDASLTYISADGSVDDEVRRIYLERTDQGFLIADDEIVG